MRIYGDVLVVCREEELREAKRAGRKPRGVGFKRGDVIPREQRTRQADAVEERSLAKIVFDALVAAGYSPDKGAVTAPLPEAIAALEAATTSRTSAP